MTNWKNLDTLASYEEMKQNSLHGILCAGIEF